MHFIWVIIFQIVPLITLWLLYGKILKSYINLILISTLLVSVGIIWDIWGVSINIWAFGNNNFGYYFANLPIEEYMSFLLFPALVTSIFIVLNKKIYG